MSVKEAMKKRVDTMTVRHKILLIARFLPAKDNNTRNKKIVTGHCQNDHQVLFPRSACPAGLRALLTCYTTASSSQENYQQRMGEC